jgi:hypothetical protein
MSTGLLNTRLMNMITATEENSWMECLWGRSDCLLELSFRDFCRLHSQHLYVHQFFVKSEENIQKLEGSSTLRTSRLQTAWIGNKIVGTYNHSSTTSESFSEKTVPNGLNAPVACVALKATSRHNLSHSCFTINR